MKHWWNSFALLVLLAFASVGISRPTIIDITAEEFMNLEKVTVRQDGTLTNQSSSPDIICTGCTSTYHYTKVGDGNPHQNFVITQKGGTLVNCATSTTSTGTGYSTTLDWSLSLGVNSAFSSAGFGVSESETYSVSNTFTCNGVAAEGGDICVLFYQAVTAFTVDVTQVLACECSGGSTIDRGTATVYAPNANQMGSIAGRGINVAQHGVVQCSGNADRRVNYYCGPPGGPEFWNGLDAGPWVSQYVNNRAPAGCSIPIEANRYTD
ncbi:hypothetical protein AtubIFM55763_010642 [Aspergillus tubingensis]|uniref:uncharacterized protein n=1 Tax=Aspergillus tubingensis TaxID=5068 RepID=UPI00157889F3|nr:uncharacterized protein AtWU_00515 [Aspergillus tubingensis]GFN10720.1 hypothetical protein AtWU_00515 [Aspergillus tubingensis]GLA78153.1 hypothetical protein AtubIFM55763_010642 [Aspergillus tubingensis]GLB22580.1 hypothetical protein AtubIFM61612_003154 [Aspergillus tubingensis]